MNESKLKAINLLLLDVDGVLTDGTIIYNDDGTETKVFSVKDGFGLRMLMDSGVITGIVTGRSSNALNHRCKNLGIHYLFDGVSDKKSILDDIIEKTGVTTDQMAFVGDDLPDIPLMKRVGFPIAVADAHELVRENAVMVTRNKGGQGAVRELCETILKAKNKWDNIANGFLK